MLDMNSVINQMLVLFIMLMVGFVAGKLRVIDEIGTKKLTQVVLNICQACMVLGSVMNVEQAVGAVDILRVLGIAFVFYILAMLLAQLIPVVLHTPREDSGLYKFMTVFGNVGFMGFPVVASLFGPQYVFYASIFNIPFYLLTYSIGIYYISGGKSSFNWKSLINTTIGATILAMAILLLRVPVPAAIEQSVASIGDMVVPCAMLIIGSSMAHMDIRQALGQWKVYVFSLIRLLVLPVIVWAVLGLFVKDPVMLGIATVISAMPVGSTATMFAVEFNGNERLASWSVFVSTIMSVVTIPLMVYFLLV